MSGRRLGVLLASGVLAALIALTSSACSRDQEGQNSAKGEWGGEPNANTAKVNPLVGTWCRVRKCEEQVRLMKEAGLDELIPQWVSPSEFSNAASAQGSPPPGEPCKERGTAGCRMTTSSIRTADSPLWTTRVSSSIMAATSS